ncbi:head GIN domain-containing protein [Chloroflexota bacterium]
MPKCKWTTVIPVIVLGLLTVASGCIPGVGPTVTGSDTLAAWDFDYSDFTRIEAGYAFDVEIVKADSHLVRITVDDNLYEYLDVRKQGDTLHIGLKPNYNYDYRKITQKATINLPDLEKLELSGASKAKVDGFSSSHIVEFELSGASEASGSIEMADGRFDLSGASSLELQGSANDIIIEASGASHVKLADFSTRNADVTLSGASDCSVNLKGQLDANLSGAAKLSYIGQPALGDIDISGGSSLKKLE